MSEKKILYIIKRPGIGGVQTFVKVLNRYLKEKDYGFKPIIYFHYPDYLFDLESFDGFKTYTLTKSKIVLLTINFISKLAIKTTKIDLKKVLIRRHFKSVLRKENVGIVHLNTDTVDYLIPIILNLKIPIVLTLHGIYKDLFFNESNLNKEAERKRIQYIFNSCSKITYFSQDNLKPFDISLNREVQYDLKFEKILNPFYNQNSNTHSSKSEVLKFALFGRGFQIKGWYEALEAFKILTRKGYLLELHFYGDGIFLKNLISKNKRLNNFYFHSQTFEPLKEMKRIDVGLVPSYTEEMPFTIIEYLACGKPVIATDTGDIKNMLLTDDGELAGELIQLENGIPSVNELVEKMEMYILSMNKLINDKRNSVLAFEKFDVSTIGNKYNILYDNLLK